MRNPFAVLVCVALLLGLLFADELLDLPKGSGAGNSAVTEPSGELKSLVQPLLGASVADPEALSSLFLHARTIPEDMTSGKELLMALDKLSRLLEEYDGTYSPGLSADVKRVLRSYVGKEMGPLSEEDKRRWREACDAIAWAISKTKKNFLVKKPDTTFQDQGIPNFVLGKDPINGGLICQPIEDGELPDSEVLFGDPARGPPQQEKQDDIRQKPQSGDQSGFRRYPTKGLVVNREINRKVLGQIPTFRDAVPLRFGNGQGKTRLLYRAARHFDPNLFSDERQVVGDCVSHATRNACDMTRAAEILVDAEPEEWINRGATELVYGMRRYRGSGMLISTAAKIITESGGVLLRKQYGSVDLSKYNGHIGDRWGTSGGPPRELIAQARQHQMLSAATIKSVNEARDAIWNKYAIIFGAQASFSEVRDKHGFGRWTGSNWSHAQSIGAVSTAYALAGDDWRRYGKSKDSPCFLVLNSWGAWNRGPKGTFTDIPDGAYWITANDMQRLIQQEQVIAFGKFQGWKSKFSGYNVDFLDIDGPKSYPSKRYYGLIEVVKTSTRNYVVKDITLPNVETVEPDPIVPDPIEPEPFKPDPEPVKPVVNTKWLSYGDGYRLAKKTKKLFVLVIGIPGCRYCPTMKNNVGAAHDQYPEFICTYTNYNDLPNNNLHIRSFPTTMIFKDGKMVSVDGFVGAASVESILEKVKKHAPRRLR